MAMETMTKVLLNLKKNMFKLIKAWKEKNI